MSMNIKPRLWSQLWDHASLFAATKRCKEPIPLRPLVANTIFSNTTRRAFSLSKIRAFNNSSPETRVRKGFAYGGDFFLDLSSGSSAAPSIASCTTTVEKNLYSTASSPRRSFHSNFQHVWRREIHSSNRRRQRGYARRNKSSASNIQNDRRMPQETHKPSQITSTPPSEETVTDPNIPHSSSKYHLPHMPKMPHRPTREELLAAATGFWSRLKVRFKWFTIRGGRPWNVDDWSAFVSWFVLGNIAWIFIGTTTFFSLVILSINTVVAQGKTRKQMKCMR